MIDLVTGSPLVTRAREGKCKYAYLQSSFSPVTPVTPVTPFRSGLYSAREASISPRFVTGEIDHPVTPCNKSIFLTEIGSIFEGYRDDLTLAHVIKGGS